MKLTDKKKPINTIPKGVWESNRPIQNKDKDKTGAPSNEIKDEPRSGAGCEAGAFMNARAELQHPDKKRSK